MKFIQRSGIFILLESGTELIYGLATETIESMVKEAIKYPQGLRALCNNP
jgi:hypothetical protein